MILIRFMINDSDQSQIRDWMKLKMLSSNVDSAILIKISFNFLINTDVKWVH